MGGLDPEGRGTGEKSSPLISLGLLGGGRTLNRGRTLNQGLEVSQPRPPRPLALTGESNEGWRWAKGHRGKASAPQPLKVHKVVKLKPLQMQPLQAGFQVTGRL